MTDFRNLKIGNLPLFVETGTWVFHAAGSKSFRAPAIFGENSPAAFEFTVGLADERRIFQSPFLGSDFDRNLPFSLSTIFAPSRKALIFKAGVSFDTDTGGALEAGLTFGVLEELAQGSLAVEAVTNRPLGIGPLTIPSFVGAGVSSGSAAGIYLLYDRPTNNGAVGQGAVELEYTVVVPYEGEVTDAILALRDRMFSEPQEVFKEILDTGVVSLEGGQSKPIKEVFGEIDEADKNGDLPPSENIECFAAGTIVSLKDGSSITIERLGVGDLVQAFAKTQTKGKLDLQPRRVTAVHTREVEETLDFHGTIVTPGHVFLSGDGSFKKLADILEEDGTVVKEDGTVVRARTNCPVGSDEDQVLPLTYVSDETGELVTAAIRAGAPFAADGDDVVTVADAMRKVGYELGADGLFIDIDGNKVSAHWPWGEPVPQNLAENRVAFV